MNQTLFIVNGFPRSGKDTFMDYMMDEFNKMGVICTKRSSVDTVKIVARTLGWDGEKDETSRRMLSELKDLYTKYFDGPAKEIQKLLMTTPVQHVYTAMREPEEIEKMVKWAEKMDVSVCTVLIRGSNEETEHLSHSDKNVLEYGYDMVFVNDGTMEEYEQKIDSFIDYLIK